MCRIVQGYGKAKMVIIKSSSLKFFKQCPWTPVRAHRGASFEQLGLLSVGPNSPAVARVVSVWVPDPRSEKGV